MKNESNKLFHYAKKNAKIIRLIYKIKGENKISIFHPYFIKNNKNNFIMIINNKVHPLSDKYQLNNSNQKINDSQYLKIKLLILNKSIKDFSFMFYECTSLKEFLLMSEEKHSIEYYFKNINKQIKIINHNNSFNINNQLEQFRNTNNKSNKNKIISEISENNFPDDFEKINNSINSSSKFLFESLPFDTNKIKNYNNDDNSSLIFSEIKNLDNSENKSFYREIFYYLKSNEAKIVTSDLNNMFYGCSSLLSVSGLSEINISNIKNISHIFEKCSSLKNINDISHWNTNKVTDISYMFAGCTTLNSFPDISIGILVK